VTRRLALIAAASAAILVAANPTGPTQYDRQQDAQIAALASAVAALSSAAPAPAATPTPTATPIATPTAAPTATPTPSSGATPLFRDDFTTPFAEGQFPTAGWGAYPYGWKDTSKNGTYDPSIVSAHDGLLDVFIRTTNGVHRVASFGPSMYLSEGKFVIRFRADAMHGYKGAWLLWPQSETWPRDGEIDFPEGDFDGTISAFMHRQGATTGSDQDAYSTSARWTDWHTATIEWRPTFVRFTLDGTVIGTSTSRIPNTPMRWQIQNETTLAGFVPADSVSGHVLIDWVAVWP
jgi:beta-glucanase (GH16 family)